MQKFLLLLLFLALSLTVSADVSNRYDVIIVGAGPVGLAAALEARQAGLSVLVIEKRLPEPSNDKSLFQNSWGSRQRNVTLDDSSVEFLNAKGLSDYAGKFAEIQVLHKNEVSQFANTSTWAEVYKLFFGRLAFGLSNIGKLEKKLYERARETGVEIVFGMQATDILSTANQVELILGAKSITSRLLVAADGSNSQTANQLAVKRIAPSDYIEQRMLTAEFRATTSLKARARYNYGDKSNELSMQGLAFEYDGSASVTIPLPIQITDLKDPEQKRAAIELLVLRAKSLGLNGEILTEASIFSNSIDKTDKVRVGSTFIIGDAARKTNPATGKGINIGFEDVMQLKNVFKKMALKVLHDSDFDKAEKIIANNSEKSNSLSRRALSMSGWVGAKENYDFLMSVLKLGLSNRISNVSLKEWFNYAREKMKMPTTEDSNGTQIKMCRQLFFDL